MTKQRILAVIDKVGRNPGSGSVDYGEGWQEAVACIYDAVEGLPNEEDPQELRHIIIAMCRDRYGTVKP